MNEPWEDLLGTDGPKIPMRLLRRRGKAFLLLPERRDCALKGLGLYAPQTRRARLARVGLGIALRLGVFPGMEKVLIRPSIGTKFGEYLADTAGSGKGVFPQIALLAGNPQATGRRCVILVLDNEGHVSAVVKAGAGQAAQNLIEQEEQFLKQAPADLPGKPSVRSSFNGGGIRGMAMSFVAGTAPATRDEQSVARLLSSWIRTESRSRVDQLPTWRRLAGAIGTAMPPEALKLADASVVPVISHGDFAPWNIKVDQGKWTAVDWERGELSGMPGWDWFHFVVQPAVLVEGLRPSQILDRMEKLFDSELFVRYAERTGIRGVEKLLAQAYLTYCDKVVGQTEGIARMRELAGEARRRWR